MAVYSRLERGKMTKELLNAINIMLETSKSHDDKTFSSVIYGKDAKTEKYQIVYEGRLRNIQNSLPCELKIGQLVWVKIPYGRLRDMHICGLRHK